MITTSKKTLRRFTPESVREQEGAPVFILAAPSILDKARFRQSLATLGTRWVDDKALYRIMRKGIETVVDPDQRGMCLEAMDSFEAAEDKAEDQELAEKIIEIQDALRGSYSPYAKAEADRGYWLSVAPVVAFQHFVKGWEGIKQGYSSQAGLVTDEALSGIDESLITAVGVEILNSFSPSKDEEKNSEPPSTSRSDRKTSRAVKSQQTADQDGKSQVSSSQATLN